MGRVAPQARRLPQGPLLRGGVDGHRGLGPTPRLEGYAFGRLLVDGEEHTKDVIVLPHRVVGGWWRREGHALVFEDLEEVVDELPERLVIGTGAYGRLRPDPAAIEQLRARHVAAESLPTAEAVRRYGELDPSRTAAALHLTC